MNIFVIINKVIKFTYYNLFQGIRSGITWYKFKANNVEFQRDFKSLGIPIVNSQGSFKIGSGFMFNSGKYHNMIGRQQQCYFIIARDACLTIGNNVGMSATSIVCYKSITIEDHVKIGGNVAIYDTDFHSLDARERNHLPEIYNTKMAQVLIKSGAFVGANSTILKGVTIGENSIIGACSVVSKNIPDNELWAGNPVKFIRKLNE